MEQVVREDRYGIELICRYNYGKGTMRLNEGWFYYTPTVGDFRKLLKVFDMSEGTDELVRGANDIIRKQIQRNKELLLGETHKTIRSRSQYEAQIRKLKRLNELLVEQYGVEKIKEDKV